MAPLKPKPFVMPAYHHSIFYEKKTIAKYLAAGWVVLPLKTGTRVQIDVDPQRKTVVSLHRRWSELLSEKAKADILSIFHEPCSLLAIVFRAKDLNFDQVAILDVIALHGRICHQMSFQERRDTFPMVRPSKRIVLVQPLIDPMPIGIVANSAVNCGLILIAPYELGFQFRVFVHTKTKKALADES